MFVLQVVRTANAIYVFQDTLQIVVHRFVCLVHKVARHVILQIYQYVTHASQVYSSIRQTTANPVIPSAYNAKDHQLIAQYARQGSIPLQVAVWLVVLTVSDA